MKVGVSGALHDSRLMPVSMWSDKYEGLTGPDSQYQYPEAYADNLQGKLLLMHGMLDCVTPLTSTLRVVEALQKANKDFDLLLLPNLGHAESSYFLRRGWDYLVSHLHNVEPPKEFKLTTWEDLYDS